MFIYVITNLVNKKQYVGQTTKTLQKRFSEHCYGSNFKHMAITRAIKKYGRENFIIEKLCDCFSVQELNDKEPDWIKKLNTLSPNGYNLNSGGNNKLMHPDTKEKIRQKLTGKPKSKEHSKKVTCARAETLKQRKLNGIIFKTKNKGRVFNQERRKNLSKNKIKTSKFVGVIKEAKTVNWRSELFFKGKRFVATFEDEISAAHGYDFFLYKVGLNPIHFPDELWTEEQFNKNKTKKLKRLNKYYGITQYNNYFQVMPYLNKKKKYLGRFKSELEAINRLIDFYKINNISFNSENLEIIR